MVVSGVRKGTPDDPSRRIINARVTPDYQRDELLERTRNSRIGAGMHHVPERMLCEQHFRWRPEHWLYAVTIGRETVSLPLSAKLRPEDFARLFLATRPTIG